MRKLTEQEWEAALDKAGSHIPTSFAIVAGEVISFIDGKPHAFSQEAALKAVLRRGGAPEVETLAELVR